MAAERESATPVTASLSVVLVVGHLIMRLLPDDLQTGIFLVPGYTITRPWQVLTAGYFDDSGLNVLLAVLMVLYCGQRLRSTWGDRELARFILLVNLLQACATWVGMIVLYIVFRAEHFLFARLGGATGMVAALSVALKQQASLYTTLPLCDTEQAATTSSQFEPSMLATLVFAHAPSICLCWSIAVILLTHAGPPDELLFAANGLFFAWVYLRYYQPRQDGAAGDTSAAFAFAQLFPSPLHRPLDVVGASCFGIFSSCGCFPPASWAPHSGSAPVLPPELPELPELIQPTLPAAVTTSDPVVAERRRERARLLVEARFAEKMAAAPPAEPSAVPLAASPTAA